MGRLEVEEEVGIIASNQRIITRPERQRELLWSSGSLDVQKNCNEFMDDVTLHRARRGTSCPVVDPYGRLWIRLFADWHVTKATKATGNKGINLPTSVQKTLTEAVQDRLSILRSRASKGLLTFTRSEQ